MKKIAFDLDGTICSGWCDGPIGEILIWLLNNHPNWSFSQWVIRRHLRRAKVLLRPQVTFGLITARMLWMMPTTHAWLEKNDIHPDFITFVACNSNDPRKRAKAKASALEGRGIDAYYEDEPETRRHLRLLLPNVKIYPPITAVSNGHATARGG